MKKIIELGINIIQPEVKRANSQLVKKKKIKKK